MNFTVERSIVLCDTLVNNLIAWCPYDAFAVGVVIVFACMSFAFPWLVSQGEDHLGLICSKIITD